jgi:hypothetical protein
MVGENPPSSHRDAEEGEGRGKEEKGSGQERNRDCTTARYPSVEKMGFELIASL